MAAGGNRNLCLLCLHEIDRDAPCEEDGTCENCRDDPNAKFYMTSYAYYKAIIGEALLRELDKNKNGNASFLNICALSLHICKPNVAYAQNRVWQHCTPTHTTPNQTSVRWRMQI